MKKLNYPRGRVEAIISSRVAGDVGINKSYVDAGDAAAAKGLTHVLNVDINGNDSTGDGSTSKPYLTVKATLDSITDNSSTNRYVVAVGPGIYTEDNPIQGKEYVALKAVGDLVTTRIVAANPTADLITMAAFFVIEGITFWGVTGATNYAINQEVAGLTSLGRCAFAECSNGIHINHASANMSLTDVGIYNLTITTVKGIYQEAGVLSIHVLTAALGNITTLLESTGVNSKLRISNISAELATLGTALFLRDQVKVDMASVNIGYMSDGLVVEDSANVRVNSTYIHDATNDGFRINNVGTDTVVVIQSTTVENSANYDINLLSATSSLIGSGQTSIDNINFVTGAQIYASIIDAKEDDEGLNILGEIHVGVAERGSESVFGEGDSYTRGMLVYTYDGATFVDVSTEARSASGSTFAFPNVNIGTAVYIASSLTATDVIKHYGIKSKVDTAGVVGTGEIVIEYWNGAAWTEVNGMEVQSGGDYFPLAKHYFESIGSHHIRYDNVLITDSWTKNDPITPALGTDYYWTRFRIASAITTAPIIEQFKLHTSRFEVNGDGWVEYFGKARPIGRLGWEFGVLEKAGGAGDDRDMYLGDTLDVGMKKNRFDNGKIARVGFNTVLPMDLDTSSPITFSWNIIAEAAGNQNVNWILRWGYSTDGDSVYPSAPGSDPTSLQTYSVSIPAPNIETSKWYKTTLDISDMVSRRDGEFPDTLWFTISRDGVADSYAGTIDVIGIDATYIKWSEGGHI